MNILALSLASPWKFELPWYLWTFLCCVMQRNCQWLFKPQRNYTFIRWHLYKRDVETIPESTTWPIVFIDLFANLFIDSPDIWKRSVTFLVLEYVKYITLTIYTKNNRTLPTLLTWNMANMNTVCVVHVSWLFWTIKVQIIDNVYTKDKVYTYIRQPFLM